MAARCSLCPDLVQRKAIALIPKLNKLEAGPLKAEFSQEAAKVLAEVETVRIHQDIDPGNMVMLTPAENQLRLDHIRPKKRAERLKKMFTFAEPAAAILLAWDNIEIAVLKLVAGHGVYIPPTLAHNPNARLVALRSKKHITEEVHAIINELQDLRTKVAHAMLDPSADAAWDYVQATERLIPMLKKKPEWIAKRLLLNWAKHDNEDQSDKANRILVLRTDERN